MPYASFFCMDRVGKNWSLHFPNHFRRNTNRKPLFWWILIPITQPIVRNVVDCLRVTVLNSRPQFGCLCQTSFLSLDKLVSMATAGTGVERVFFCDSFFMEELQARLAIRGRCFVRSRNVVGRYLFFSSSFFLFFFWFCVALLLKIRPFRKTL